MTVPRGRAPHQKAHERMIYDFGKLPKAQQDALAQIALLSDGTDFPRKTVLALERKGLIVGEDTVMYGPTMAPIDRIPMTVRRYQMPLAVHMAWCQWCSENYADEE